LERLDLTWHNRLHIDLRDLEILKNIPKDSGLILAANHSDEMDPESVSSFLAALIFASPT